MREDFWEFYSFKIEFLRTNTFSPSFWATSSMASNSVTVRGTGLTLLVVKATSILAKICPFRRGYIPSFYVIVYLCLGPNPCISRDVLADVTLSPTQDCHLMCLFEPTSRLDYSSSNGIVTQSAPNGGPLWPDCVTLKINKMQEKKKSIRILRRVDFSIFNIYFTKRLRCIIS